MDTDREGANGLEPSQNKVQFLSHELDVVKGIMIENGQIMENRLEKLDGLERISGELEEKAKDFKKIARNVEFTYWWKNVKLIVVIVVVVLIIILIIILLATGVIPVSSPMPSLIPTPKP